MSAAPKFCFRLYVAGDAPNSVRALANLQAMCDDRLKGRHNIEVVDVFGQAGRALADGIVMTPTLVRVEPSPIRRLVGSLEQADSLAIALGLGASLG